MAVPAQPSCTSVPHTDRNHNVLLAACILLGLNLFILLSILASCFFRRRLKQSDVESYDDQSIAVGDPLHWASRASTLKLRKGIVNLTPTTSQRVSTSRCVGLAVLLTGVDISSLFTVSAPRSTTAFSAQHMLQHPSSFRLLVLEKPCLSVL